MSEAIPVKVAVRVRPLIQKEIDEGCQVCVTFLPNEPQLILGKDRSFTFDYVLASTDSQTTVYEESAKNLIKHVFKGYNATVLAYGQTGSGKTFTMGGGYAESLQMDQEAMGVIPRIVSDIFEKIGEQSENYSSTVHVSYLEIINEDLNDLLTLQRTSLSIREDSGQIKIPGLKEQLVTGPVDTMRLLEQGGALRTTAATAMNSTSSRSHAIFTILIEHRHKEDTNDFWTAKLTLVDLAGSERVKRTHAEGERFKEGVNINKGLLALGNVISALGDEAQKKMHIPYRDSKLTRILQDSLGGNSHTLMIACVSPADSNMEETLNTLRYADRARKIKNKPVVNWDPQTAKIMQLQEVIQQLHIRLVNAGVTDVVTSSISSTSTASSQSLSPSKNIKEKIQSLKDQIKELEVENESLSKELQHSVDQSTRSCEKNVRLEMRCDRLKGRLHDLETLGLDFDLLGSSMTVDTNPCIAEQLEKLKKISAMVNEQGQEDSAETATEEEDEDVCEADDDLGELDSPESRQIAKQHTLRRAKMNSELEELNNLLAKKEKLATQMTVNDTKVTAMKEQYETTVKQLEEEISSLQGEKENLSTALQSAKTNTATTKVSEQRRKRLQELETQLTDLKKKITEQKKLLKLKETSDKQVTKLNTDIQGLKQQRVRLMKQMKEDADTWRKWKQQKDREVLQLQQKDRKRQFEITKLQRENQKQQNVLQRKSEEAAAANRRLKEAMAKQKTVLEERNQKFDKFDKTSVGNRIKKILSHELDVKVGVMEAKYHRQSLLQDRKILAEELKTLKESLDDNGPPSKKMAWMDDSGQKCETSFKEEATKEKIKQLKEQIEIRNAQIADLQQKIFDAEREGKGKEAKDGMHTMMEAKIAIKWLMEQSVSFKADNNRVKSLLDDEKDNKSSIDKEQNKFIEDLENEMERLKKLHEKDLLKTKKDHQKEIQLLLGVTGKTEVMEGNSTDLQQKVAQQKEEIHKLTEECALMEQHMTTYMYKEKNLALMPELKVDDEVEDTKSPFLTPRPKTRVLQSSKAANLNVTYEYDEDEEEEDEAFEDPDKDPDWQKTPLYKLAAKASPPRDVKRRKTALFQQRTSKERGDRGCGCTTNCRSKRCTCFKNYGFCNDFCKCKSCENKEVQMPESTTTETHHTLLPPLSTSVDEPDSRNTTMELF